MAVEVVKFTSRTEQVRKLVQASVFQAVQETFELDIKPDAVQNSPKLTGTNARSIDTEVVKTDQGVTATIFTQSGYGGYLELGTSKMKAQPYIYPAWEKFRVKMNKRIKELING